MANLTVMNRKRPQEIASHRLPSPPSQVLLPRTGKNSVHCKTSGVLPVCHLRLWLTGSCHPPRSSVRETTSVLRLHGWESRERKTGNRSASHGEGAGRGWTHGQRGPIGTCASSAPSLKPASSTPFPVSGNQTRGEPMGTVAPSGSAVPHGGQANCPHTGGEQSRNQQGADPPDLLPQPLFWGKPQDRLVTTHGEEGGKHIHVTAEPEEGWAWSELHGGEQVPRAPMSVGTTACHGLLPM